MGATKIQSGYGSGRRSYGKKGNYADRNNGKKVTNGGFNYNPVADFHDIPQEKWDSIFPDGYKPSWDK